VEQIRETRFAVQFEVRVWGSSEGKAFSQVAQTIEVSKSGARLAGIACVLKPGDVVGVQHGAEKSRFRVVWNGTPGTDEAGQLGIECLDIDRCLWPERLPSPRSLPSPPSQSERRRHPRFSCVGVVHMNRPGESFKSAGKLSDLSLGGCYAETMSPFPVGSELEMILRTNQMEAKTRGVVRTTHPNMGNGIEFVDTGDEERSRLETIIERLASAVEGDDTVVVEAERRRGSRFSLETEAMLAILEQKLGVTREEFLRTLDRIYSKS
jgi:PilZ domain-containing protein